MAKQIKIGFDKTPAPITKVFQQLIDKEGTPLFDDAGNPLVTEDNAVATGTLLSDSALSIHANNSTDPGGGGAIAVEEQFKEFSEVSSSLLGVPRAEEQLSLFSDVATYGLDTDNWDASDFFSAANQNPVEWYRKEHPVYGRRSNVAFYEGSDEQALYIKGFPTQYTFPRGPKELNEDDPRSYMVSYMMFIAIGRYLYDFWVAEGQEKFAKDNFISRADASVVNSEDVIISDNLEIANLRDTGNVIFEDFDSGPEEFKPFDVKYGQVDIQDSFDAIERWTVVYDKIKDQQPFTFPSLKDGPGTAKQSELDAVSEDAGIRIEAEGYRQFREFFLIRRTLADVSATRPGNSSLSESYGILQSKRTFRYQPGRVSGFTFGTRILAGDPNRQDQVAEWGCANDSDMYMFQLKGSTFNIVRRSTKKMPEELLERQGLSPAGLYQSTDPRLNPKRIKGVGNTNLLWETVIPKNKFNGDRLDGNGESGYILRGFDDVTMYKIEFSWYGAIGAKFYAYVPVGVGECRWVLMHTFVIENGMGEPVMENPDFRFRYLVQTANTENIKSPMFLYKYGSSCYIDGGDEGTQRLSTVSTESKEFDERTPILGILPKENILSSVGYPNINLKKSYPSTISVTADKACRLDFEEIKGSPQGVHYNYSPSIIINGIHPKSRTLRLQYRTGTILSGNSAINILQPSKSDSTDELGANKFLEDSDKINHGFKLDLSNEQADIANTITAPDDTQATDMYEFMEVTGLLTITDAGRIKIQSSTLGYEMPSNGDYIRVSGAGQSPTTPNGDYRVYDVNTVNREFTLRTLDGSTTGGQLSTNPGVVTETISILRAYPTTFDGLQIGDTLRIGGVDRIIKHFGTYQPTSTGKTRVTFTTSTTSTATNQTAKLIYETNDNEKYAHIIANGVYGRYIDEGPANNLYARGFDAVKNDYYGLVPSSAVESSTGSDADDFREDDLGTKNPSGTFLATLSSYNNVVASDTPIYSNKFKIHFLNPDARDNTAGSSQHFAEFLVGVTPYKPLAHDNALRSDPDPEIKFNKPGGIAEFDREEFPTIEYAHKSVLFDTRRRVATREIDYSYGNRFSIDPRLDRGDNGVDTHAGVASANGFMSTIQGTVSTDTFLIDTADTAIERNFFDEDSNQLRMKISFFDQAPPADAIIPGFSEVGLNFGPLTTNQQVGGTSVKFQSQVVYPQIGEDFKPYVLIDNDPNSTGGHFETLNTLSGDNKAIQTKTISLSDDWRATTFTDATATSDAEERFKEKSFLVQKAVSFNTQPLYPVFALSNYAKINCILIEEISETGTVKTHTPTLITEDTTWNNTVSIVSPKLSSNANTPSAFNNLDSNPNSACRYDISTLNPLRPGNIIYSTFVSANDTTAVELDNIFGQDRKGISRGALNNRAVFITATKIDDSIGDGNIQLSLTSKEQ